MVKHLLVTGCVEALLLTGAAHFAPEFWRDNTGPIVAVAVILLLAVAFYDWWKARAAAKGAERQPSGPATANTAKSTGDNSPAVNSIGRDFVYNAPAPTQPQASKPRRSEVGEWPIADAISAVQEAIGNERDAWLEFRHAANRDEIGVWGRPEKDRGKWSELLKEIAPDYWDNWKLVRDLEQLRATDRAHTTQEGGPRAYNSFTGVLVDEYEIERKWLGRGPDMIVFGGPAGWSS